MVVEDGLDFLGGPQTRYPMHSQLGVFPDAQLRLSKILSLFPKTTLDAIVVFCMHCPCRFTVL